MVYNRNQCLAMMQPYFFPALRYFQLRHAADTWVIFDTAQFTRKSWISRNRVLSSNLARPWQYLSIPCIRAPRSSSIDEIYIDESKNWRTSQRSKLQVYSRSPFYKEGLSLFDEGTSNKSGLLIDTLVSSLKSAWKMLGLDASTIKYSSLEINPEEVRHPGQYALRAAEKLGAKKYINPSGGSGLFREHEFSQGGIDLRFLVPNKDLAYAQLGGEFVGDLSILDTIMCLGLENTRELLAGYELRRLLGD